MIYFYGLGILNHLSGAHGQSTILMLGSGQKDEGIDGEEARFTVAHQDLRKLVVKVLSCPLIGRMYWSIKVTTRFVELESRIARRTFATVF